MERGQTVSRPRFEGALRNLAFFCGLFHILLSVYRFYRAAYLTPLMYVDYALGALLLVSGGGYLLYLAIKNKGLPARTRTFLRPFSKPVYAIMFGLSVWYALSVLCSPMKSDGAWLSRNIYDLYDGFVSFFVLLPLARFFAGSRRPLKIVIRALTAILTPLMIYVIIEMFSGRIIDLPGEYDVMMLDMNGTKRLWIGCHANNTGAYAMTMIMLCVYMAFSEKKVLKPLYVLSAGIHLVILVLTNSRTAMLTIGLFVCCAAILLAAPRLKRMSRRSKVLLLLGAVLVLAGGYAVFTGGIYSLLGRTTDAENASSRLLNFVDTGRFLVWGAAFRSYVYSVGHFLFGVTPASVSDMIMHFTGGEIYYHTHNQVLEIGVALGVPAMLAFVWWLVLLFKRGIKKASPKSGAPFSEKLLPLICAMLFVSNMLEVMLLFHNLLPGCIFFLLAGYVLKKPKIPESGDQGPDDIIRA